MYFKSKANTLKKLNLKNAKVPDLEIFNCNNFLRDSNKILNKIQKKFFFQPVAVRSSFNNEDTIKSSNAGKYKSYLNINTKNRADLEFKIYQVINSKKNKKKK